MQGEFIEICPHFRRKWIQLLSLEADIKKIPMPTVFARTVEFEIIKKLQKHIEIEDGVSCQRYGDVDLLDMEPLATHCHFASMFYCKSMQRIASAIRNTLVLGPDSNYLQWLNM
jgi:hypothetical protein